MATCGKLEARITVRTGGWTATTGGTATVAAGTYYHSSDNGGAGDNFLDAVGDAMATASGTSCVITASLGEAGTGIATITFGSATAITWVSTDLRDILGFTGNSASATVHTAPRALRGVWLSTRPYNALNGGTSWRGHLESDLRTVSNRAGNAWSVAGQYHRRIDPLSWEDLPPSRIWVADETTVNQSLERFWLDTVFADAAWATPGGPYRWHPDAANDAVYGTYKFDGGAQFRPEQTVANYTGYWRVRLPPLIQVPG